MPDVHEKTRRDWRIPDVLWERIEPLRAYEFQKPFPRCQALAYLKNLMYATRIIH